MTLGLLFRANNPVTIDITTNDKDRVGVDVAWKQQSGNDSRHYVGI